MDTITKVLNDLKLKNQDNEFKINQYGFVRLDGKVYGPEEVKIIRTYRFEGNSDPADAAIIYLIRTYDGIVGYSLDAYGVYTNHTKDDGYADLIRRMEKH